MDRWTPSFPNETLNIATPRRRLTLGDDGPVSPMGIEASTPLARPELFLPPKWHFQPPRRIIPVAGHGTRPGYPPQPPFIAPESPPQGPKIPIFIDLRSPTARASFPDVSVRRRMDRTSAPLKFQQPLHPLMFDQYPDRRLTYGGLSSSAWTPQQRDGSLPANLDQNQFFQPRALNREVGYYSQPLYPVSGFPERFARPLSLPADRPPPLDVSQVQSPLLFDQIPDRRFTYGGIGSSPLLAQQRDRSLPTNLSLNQREPPIFDRTVDTRASFPLGHPLMSSTMRRRMDPNVTIHQEPQQLIHTRPFEPLYGTLEVRASPVERTPPTAGPLLHRSFSDSNVTNRGIEDTEAGQRTHLPTAIEHLRRKLAEAETSLQIEQMTVNELRAQIDEETRRYEEELLHAKSLAEEVHALKSYLVELEKKTEALYDAMEVEKNRYNYMQKMKGASPEMLAEREAQMKLVEEEKQKYQNLLAFNQRLLAELNEVQNEVYRLKSLPKVKGAQEKLEILEDYQGKIEFEEDCARDLLQEVETQRALNEQLNDQLNQEKLNTEAKKQALQSVLAEKAKLHAKVDEMVIQLENYAQKHKRMVGQMKDMEDAERNRSKRNISSAARTQLVLEQSLATRSLSPNFTPVDQSSFKEANASLQKLVAEREKLHSQFNHLKEQKDILNNTLASVRGENDELRKQLSGSPNILNQSQNIFTFD